MHSSTLAHPSSTNFQVLHKSPSNRSVFGAVAMCICSDITFWCGAVRYFTEQHILESDQPPLVRTIAALVQQVTILETLALRNDF